MNKAVTIDPGTRVGHIHLRVSNIDKAIDFYRDVLGFEVMIRLNDQAAFLSAGGYHHHIGLNTWDSKDGEAPARGTTGLYHVAFVYPTRKALAVALRKVVESGVKLTGAADHGVSEAIYFNDPDGNGIEIYWDRDKEDWPLDDEGNIAMYNRALDLDDLLQLSA